MTALLAQADPAATATGGSAEFWVFWLLAPIALGAAIAMVLLRNPVHAALMLVVNFFVIALLFAVLEAQFLAVVQIIVYAGAIMVLFLFVLMLLGVDQDQAGIGGQTAIRGQTTAALVLGVLLFVALAVGVAGPFLSAPFAGLDAVNGAPGGNVRGIGELLFTDYVWPFEVASVLLVIAAIGAIVLGSKRDRPEDVVETERFEEVSR